MTDNTALIEHMAQSLETLSHCGANVKVNMAQDQNAYVEITLHAAPEDALALMRACERNTPNAAARALAATGGTTG